MTAVENAGQNQGRNPHRQSATGLAKASLAIAVIVGIVAFFWDGLTFLGKAWTQPEYSYGPMVPLITAYMTLREMHLHPVTANQDSKIPGIVVVALGLVAGLLGHLLQIPLIITYGFIIVIGGLVLILAGSREGLRFWPGWLHLFFMAPLPGFVYIEVSLYLQTISSQLGVEFVYLMGIPVFLDGHIIDLGIYKLQVAEACSGLRYLFPLLSFGWLFAVLYNGPHWHRVVLFLSTIPITILMNSFRIGVIGVLVSKFGIEQAEGFLHYFEGWIIFIACIVILFIEAWLLSRLIPRHRRHPRILDIDFDGILGPLSKINAIPLSRPLIAAATAILVAGVVWQVLPNREPVAVDRVNFVRFPMLVGNWKGRAKTLDPTIERILDSDDYLLVDYSSADGRPPVNLFSSFYESLTHGSRINSRIHSPEVCIPAGGWEISSWQQTPISFDGNITPEFSVNRAVIHKDGQRQLVYYWFDQRGRRLTSGYQAKISTLWDTVTVGRADGALVRVVTPIVNAGGEAAADKHLQNFLKEVLPLMSDYLPGL